MPMYNAMLALRGPRHLLYLPLCASPGVALPILISHEPVAPFYGRFPHHCVGGRRHRLNARRHGDYGERDCRDAEDIGVVASAYRISMVGASRVGLSRQLPPMGAAPDSPQAQRWRCFRERKTTRCLI